jgi:hypothetical protein
MRKSSASFLLNADLLTNYRQEIPKNKDCWYKKHEKILKNLLLGMRLISGLFFTQYPTG